MSAPRGDNGRRALSVEEFADAVGLHPQTVRGYVRDGTIRSVNMGRRVLIPIEELDRLLGRPCPTCGRPW